MKKKQKLMAILTFLFSPLFWALDYPSTPPGEATATLKDGQLILSNQVLDCKWTLNKERFAGFKFTNKHTNQLIALKTGYLPCIAIDARTAINLATVMPVRPAELEDNGFLMKFSDEKSGLSIAWSAELKNNANAIMQTLKVTATRDTIIQDLVFLDGIISKARQIGQVDGSVVVCDNIFLAVEHPLAKNTVAQDSHVRCSLPRGNVLKSGQTWKCTSVMGVVPPGQLRRGFLYYIEQRRAHPYRPFLHYNSWYHLNIGRPDNHMTEAECLDTIEHFGRELIAKRKVKMDAFVWDDGWDDFNSLWGFHKDFPDGFERLKKAGAKYKAAQGVWMSPWGGYGGPKSKRITYGKSKGYETNRNGFSMAGKKYRKAFLDACLLMMRQNGVVFFKFDGMGAGGGTGAQNELADDVDAVLNLTGTLRNEIPELFISATVGTWASPFWTLYADSIWRQGGDTGFYGPGNGRQKWITYRDMYCYRCIVQWGPLYPLNSLMLHGPCIGERTNPAKMSRDEKSVADEFWTFFGSGTNLQELYISPNLMTDKMWDHLAAAAKWSRSNSDVLVDTHWIGGDPGLGNIYGWASWQPHKGIIVLRNPSEKVQTFGLELARDLELPDKHLTDYRLQPLRSKLNPTQLRAQSTKPIQIRLQPFEVLVCEASPIEGAGTYNAEAYRKQCADREKARIKAAQKTFEGGGTWEYVYQGHTYQRRFLPDGKAHLYINGSLSNAWHGFKWHIEGTRLVVDKPDGTTEAHYLNEQGQLVLPAGLGTARKVLE